MRVRPPMRRFHGFSRVLLPSSLWLQQACATSAPPPLRLRLPAVRTSSNATPESVDQLSNAVAATSSTLLWASFTPSTVDLHNLLLAEAHEKHGVERNVPPQMPPPLSPNSCFPNGVVEPIEAKRGGGGGAPEPDPVPKPVYPPGLAKRMEGQGGFLYPPTYDPPPLHTTGARSLADGSLLPGSGSHSPQWDSRARRVAAVRDAEWSALWRLHAEGEGEGEVQVAAAEEPSPCVSEPQTHLREESSSTPAATGGEAIVRAAANPEMRYHCSVCGRGYRQRSVAVEHVQLRHPGAGQVLEGPGPGEVLAVVTDVAGPPRSSATASPKSPPASSAADPASGEAPARATPEGAAPSLKRRLTSVVSNRSGSRKGGAGSPLSIKDASKLYPNPFGAAADAAAEAAKLEEKEPVNPFVGDSTQEGASEVEVSAGAHETPLRSSFFRCPVCQRIQQERVFSCRLLDRLMDHLEESHAEEGGVDALEPEELSRLYDQQSNPWRYAATSPTDPQQGTPTALEPGSKSQHPSTPLESESLRGGTALPNTDQGSELAKDVATENNGTSALATAAVEERVRLHARMPSSILLRGRVADVQQGYTGKQMVLQYVVEVRSEDPSSQEKPSDTGKDGPPEVECLVVRYLGDPSSFTALRAQVHMGCDVMVSGTLRLDRRVDSTSKRRHAYPLVVVIPPYGFLKSLS